MAFDTAAPATTDGADQIGARPSSLAPQGTPGGPSDQSVDRTAQALIAAATARRAPVASDAGGQPGFAESSARAPSQSAAIDWLRSLLPEQVSSRAPQGVLSPPDHGTVQAGALSAPPQAQVSGSNSQAVNDSWQKVMGLYKQTVGSVPAPAKPDLSDDQKSMAKMNFFLSLMAGGAKPGATLLGGIGESGKDTMRQVADLQRENVERGTKVHSRAIDEALRTFNLLATPDVDATKILQRIAEQSALRPGDLETARQKGDIDVDVARRKPRTLAPGASEIVDGNITTTAPGRELDPSQQRLNTARTSYYESMAAKAAKLGLDKPQQTALIQNVQYLVDAGIATDNKDAWTKLRTSMEKSDNTVITSFANTLMRDPSYRGIEGRKRAIADARGMAQALSAVDDEVDDEASPGSPASARPVAKPKQHSAGGKTFTDADLAFTAKKYGVSVDEVKRQLGVK